MKINPIVWPIGITLSILGIATMCIWTIVIAQSSPVYNSNDYFADYRDVDMNINSIIKSQEKFDNKYSVFFQKKGFKVGENSIKLKIVDKNGSDVNSANVEIMITRPHTSVNDQTLKSTGNIDGVYTFEPFLIEELGRWQIKSKITIDNLVSYNKLEVNATN